MTDKNWTGNDSADRPTQQDDSYSWASLPVIGMLPDRFDLPDTGGEFFDDLRGATIVQIGGTIPRMFEGGGLIIDYRHAETHLLKRIVLAFNERAMWVEWQGCLEP